MWRSQVTNKSECEFVVFEEFGSLVEQLQIEPVEQFFSYLANKILVREKFGAVVTLNYEQAKIFLPIAKEIVGDRFEVISL